MEWVSITAWWPPIIVMCVAYGVAHLISHYWKFYSHLLDTTEVGRFPTLDGLRGLLAFGVFFTHAATFWFFIRDGVWDYPPSRLYTLAGQVPVVMFFMLTGFLFWDKALRGPIRAGKLYVNRFWRIMPLYWGLVAFLVIAALADAGFHLRVGPLRFLKEIAWLLIPGLRRDAPLNDSAVGGLVRMAWTLRYELEFYFLLPLLAVFVRPRRFVLLLIALAGLIAARPYLPQLINTHTTFWVIFFCGFAAAFAIRRLPRINAPRLLAANVACVLLVPVVFFTAKPPPLGVYRIPSFALICPAFLLIAYGADLFGLLRFRAARMLGLVSYSIYLMHLPVLYFALRIAGCFTPVESLSAAAYWGVMAGAAIAVVVVSSITYRWLEHPFFAKPVNPTRAEPITEEGRVTAAASLV